MYFGKTFKNCFCEKIHGKILICWYPPQMPVTSQDQASWKPAFGNAVPDLSQGSGQAGIQEFVITAASQGVLQQEDGMEAELALRLQHTHPSVGSGIPLASQLLNHMC